MLQASQALSASRAVEENPAHKGTQVCQDYLAQTESTAIQANKVPEENQA